ncbi:MAG: response regulator [Alphaproteobacteria bacterium]
MTNLHADLSVLVVDDNEFTRELIKDSLRDIGIRQVVTTEDGEAALKVLGSKKHPIHLIVCDWDMPNMNGLDLLKRVRSVDSDMPFLMVTGRGTEEDVREAAEFGVSAYIVKPFSPDQLETKVSTLARRIGK